MKAVLVGKKIGVNAKTGNPSCTYYVQVPFTEYEAKNASCDGNAVNSFYCGKDFPDVKPGNTVNLEFEPGFEGRAQLVNISVIK